jgi:hypothetical protein
MKRMLSRGIVPLILVLSTIFTSTSVHAFGNNWVHGTLRRDLPAIHNARKYGMYINATELPTTGSLDSFTTAWLAVWPTGDANNPQGFSQVGLITYRNGIRWFAYSLLGIQQCVRGTPHWGNLGCRGEINDLVGLNQFHRVELIKNNGENFWRARVTNAGGQAFDVAYIPSASNTVYRVDADFEEGYVEPVDPLMTGRFYLYDPEYDSGGGWTDWPQSAAFTNQHNEITMKRKVNNIEDFPGSKWCNPGGPNHYYGITPNINNDYKYWYAGTGATKCAFLFPPVTVENTAGVLAYTGAWTHQPGWSRATNNSVSYTNAANARVTLTNWPANTSITRIYTMANNRGNQTITVEGVANPAASDNAVTTRWQVAKTWAIADGFATIDVRRDSNYIDADAFISDIPRSPVGPVYDDRHYNLKYIGNWANHIGFTGPSDNSVSYTNIAEDAVTFTFEGTQIQYFYTRANNRGRAAVTIDGIDRGFVDQCSANTQWQASTLFNGLGGGTHTIHIANAGPTGCAGSYIDVDKLVPAN